MSENTGQANVEREPKWIAETQVIENQIVESRDLCRTVRIEVDCLLKSEAPKESQPEAATVEETYTIADHRSVDKSPLTLRLTELQEMMKELMGDLVVLLERIDP